MARAHVGSPRAAGRGGMGLESRLRVGAQRHLLASLAAISLDAK
jgi:hypothetical protein